MGKTNKEYWNRRVLVDKARIINNAEKYLQEHQAKLYGAAEKEIQVEVENLYQKFADQQKVSLAEARRLIRDADFRKINWEEMIQESLELREQIRNGKGNLPEEVIEAMEKQHRKLEAQMAAFTKRGEISYLELRRIEIDRKLLKLYDAQQMDMYDYLASEYDDGYYRQVFNIQQRIGYGKDFIKPNAAAVDKAIMNQYQRKNFSQILYSHCEHFSKDLKENLVTGLIRGENLDRMASRIRQRMGVSQSAAKRLVRTETAYIYEQATKDAYQECGIEEYEYLATLDNRTSEVCQKLDGKHFRVRDALPGKNYPPMHPNCRSTTVCYFPDEKEKKKQGSRLAKDEEGKYYEVPAEMTYKQWVKKHGDAKQLLTYTEKQALNQYMSFESYGLNEKLRNKAVLTAAEKRMCSYLDAALEKMDSYQGDVVRCLDIGNKADLEKFLQGHKIGDTVTYREYTSCSAAEEYNPEANIKIYRKSKYGKDITALNSNEKEVLYKRNSKFSVVNIIEKDGIFYILEKEV